MIKCDGKLVSFFFKAGKDNSIVNWKKLINDYRSKKVRYLSKQDCKIIKSVLDPIHDIFVT